MASTFLQPARSFSRKAAINHVLVIGGGLMGSGIAQVPEDSGDIFLWRRIFYTHPLLFRSLQCPEWKSLWSISLWMSWKRPSLALSRVWVKWPRSSLPTTLRSALKSCHSSLDCLIDSLLFQKAESFVRNAVQLIQTTTDAQQPAQHADLIIEAIVENLDTKKNLFRNLDKAASKWDFFFIC
jgi:3-hydroxyacyl-CoA dehydrogenase